MSPFEPVNVNDPAKPALVYTEKDNFVYADSNFFTFFGYRLKRGDPLQVLNRPYGVVITERMAKKYFGDADPVGRILRVNGEQDFSVTGIVENPPSNTDLRYDFIASIPSMAADKNLKYFLRPGPVQGGVSGRGSF